MNNMNKRNSIISIIVVLVIIMLSVIVINELFKFDYGILTMWGADTALLFCGSILGFLGTMILGIIAYSQNNKLVGVNDELLKVNERILKLENRRIKSELEPFIINSSNHLEDRSFKNILEYDGICINIGLEESDNNNSKIKVIFIELTNVSNVFTILSFNKAKIFENTEKKKLLKEKMFNSVSTSSNSIKLFNSKQEMTLKTNETGKIAFYLSEKNLSKLLNKCIEFNFYLKNHMGEMYEETFDTLIIGSNSFIHGIHTQNYQIKKV